MSEYVKKQTQILTKDEPTAKKQPKRRQKGPLLVRDDASNLAS